MSSNLYAIMDEEAYLNALGYFAKLPVELRLIIWDFVLLEVKDHRLGGLLESSKNVLAILCCNSFLYGEISYQFYHNRIPIVILKSNHHFGYMAVKIPFDHLQILNEKTLKDKAALQQYLHAFTRHQGPNKKVHIEIPPLCYSHSEHPGRAISCWTKVTDLLDILKEWSHTCMLHVRVELVEEWVKRDRPSQSWRRDPVYYHPNYEDSHQVIADHDIAILPFSILPDWEYVLPPRLENVLSAQSNEKSPSILEKLFYHNTTNTSDIVTASASMSIRGWLLKTRHILDKELDNNYGWTADQLRLERFKHWFKDQSDLNQECESDYEKQFLTDLESDHEVVLKQDPGLDKARRRHHTLVCSHAFLNANAVTSKLRLELDEHGKTIYPLYPIWNSHIWSTYMTEGFERLDKRVAPRSCFPEEECTTYKNYRKAFPAIGRFNDALSWWGFEASFVFENHERFSDTVNCSLCSYNERPCFWCTKYHEHAERKCNYCREWAETPTSHALFCLDS